MPLTDEEIDARIDQETPSMGGLEIGTLYGDVTKDVARWAYDRCAEDCAKDVYGLWDFNLSPEDGPTPQEVADTCRSLKHQKE